MFETKWKENSHHEMEAHKSLTWFGRLGFILIGLLLLVIGSGALASIARCL